MSDDLRRAAERRWRETGAAEDGQRFLALLERAGDVVEGLRVRVVLGLLHPERLDLAAHVGHPPARAALGLAGEPAPPLRPGAQRLFVWGQAACVRAACAAARAVLERGGPGADEARRAIEAAEAWLACPCPQHYAAGEAFNRRRGELPGWAWQTVTAAHCPPRACWHHIEALDAAATALGGGDDAGSRRRGVGAVRATVRRALVAWALPAGGEAAAAPLERPVARRE
jgi:hypothetical protein